MNMTIKKAELSGTVRVCASKSEAHRILICAFMSFGKTVIKIRSEDLSEDIAATVKCLRSLGADIEVSEERRCIFLDSSNVRNFLDGPEAEKRGIINLDCKESGSTLRFMIPLVCALGTRCEFTGGGRLPERPNAPLIKALSTGGARFDREDGLPLRFDGGALKSGIYELPGNISSQYISGLLMALPLVSGKSTVSIKGIIESKPYILLTIEVLKRFGVNAEFCEEESEIHITGGQPFRSPGEITVSGDWSNGAFWICGGLLGKNDIKCEGLLLPTVQGDAEIVNICGKLKNDTGDILIDASQIPDLVPIISVLACGRNGIAEICGARRLKIKESNRIKSVAEMINSLGGKAEEKDEGLKIYGAGSLRGGTVDSFGDHRIAMSAAIAASICKNEVIVENADAVRKSYPGFWSAYESLGGIIERS